MQETVSSRREHAGMLSSVTCSPFEHVLAHVHQKLFA